ncbi:hypothetical protein ACFPOE_12735 [Caenimonas terrae]|uniref:Glycosyltransferase family 1 protein n=1 Tax=Caenimonas terrae TaxID=696074 RepID=A0ABW0NFP2_9BURK
MAKIAFLGNTNCMPFRYALHMKKMGHEVVFYIDSNRDERLHRPEFLFREIGYPYPDWIVELGWKPRGRDYLTWPRNLRRLVDTLNADRWDGVVLCGEWLKLASYLKHRGAFVALLAGSDLDVVASYKQVMASRYPGSAVASIAAKGLQMLGAFLQRRGIRKCTLVNYYPEGINPNGDLLLQEIMKGGTYARLQNRGLSVENTPYRQPSTRTGASVVVFSPTRFIWKSPLPIGYTEQENKGNDVMLRGLAQFYLKTGIAIKVHLVEKGIHVNQAKELAAALGIAHLITWHQEMSLAEILEWYAASDIILDQFGSHWLGAGAVDSMLMGRPVIGNARNDVFVRVLGQAIPMCNAVNEQEISDWLEILVADCARRDSIGVEGRDYMLRHFDAKETAISIISHIEQFARGSDPRRGP